MRLAGRRVGGWVAAILAGVLLAGCARAPKEPPFTGEPFLAVWAADADRESSDFLAVVDADPRSASYGKVLKTYPVRSRGNEPHALLTAMRDDRRVFATALATNRTFVFDLAQPLAGRLVHVDEAGPGRKLWAPGEVVSLPGGRVAVACADQARFQGDPRTLLTAPGGMAVLDAGGQLVGEVIGAEESGRAFIVAPRGAAVLSGGERIVTTNTGHGYTATMRGERQPGISVQIWRTRDMAPLRTVILEAGPRGEENLGPSVPRAMRGGRFVLVDTEGGGLYASDSLGTDAPSFRLVHDLGAGALAGGAALTPDDRFYVVALAGTRRVVSLDVSDPWHPAPVSGVRFPGREGATSVGPSALAMGADGTRVAVASGGIDVPGLQRVGDGRVHVLRLDPTGKLGVDDAFADEFTGEVGLDFGRTRWPHGETGAARPVAVLFVAPEPPPSKKRRKTADD
jgi:hypothetical protein